MRVGYACICLGLDDVRCTRTTILRNATPERLLELVRTNLDGLETILRYNEERGLKLFRIGCDLVPFASHPVNELRWWEAFADRLAVIGEWVRAHGHRLSFHASHFTILNSLNPAVVDASIADVTYYARVLEAMGLGPEHKIILHGGISTPSIAEASERLALSLERLPVWVRRHLALENDERFYSLEEILTLSKQTGLPAVIDVLHHACNPGAWSELAMAELFERTFATWSAEEGPPKMHFSSQDPEKRNGAHAYGIDAAELRRFLAETREVSRDFDIVFEAKGKDLAVLEVMPVLADDPRFEPNRGGASSNYRSN